MTDLSEIDDTTLIKLVGLDIEKELRSRGYDFGWYRKSSKSVVSKPTLSVAGYIYIFVGELHNGMVYLGFTADVKDELNVLITCTTPKENFHCYAIYPVYHKVSDNDVSLLFSSFLSAKQQGSLQLTNWFNLHKDKAYNILQGIASINGNLDELQLNPFKDSYFSSKSISNSISNTSSSGNDNSKSHVIFVRDRIYHTSFGYGRVQEIGHDDNGPTYKVHFDNGKTFILNTLTIQSRIAYKV